MHVYCIIYKLCLKENVYTAIQRHNVNVTEIKHFVRNEDCISASILNSSYIYTITSITQHDYTADSS